MGGQTKRAAPPADDAALLFELFANRQRIYDEAAVLRLTRATPALLECAIDEQVIEPVQKGRAREFAWEDVALLALERWAPRMIAEVLGSSLPYLNQIRLIRVVLPLYQIRFMHWLAVSSNEPGRPRLNVSDVLESEIGLAAAGANLVRVERHIPGFTAAMQFPSFEQRPRLVGGVVHLLRCIRDGGQRRLRIVHGTPRAAVLRQSTMSRDPTAWNAYARLSLGVWPLAAAASPGRTGSPRELRRIVARLIRLLQLDAPEAREEPSQK